MYTRLAACCLALVALPATAQTGGITSARLDAAAKAIEPKTIEWRRDLHSHPELSNRETRTAEQIAKRLRALGLEVKTGIGPTGVVGLLRGAQPGRTVGLRADMDALPVTEQTDVPFKSKATAQFRGETVGVMHACGHDSHVAILLGVAEVLAGMRQQLAGQVLFVFQPAEEGPPEGERGGAELMLEQGAFAMARPDVMYGLHVMASLPTGVIGYRAGPLMAGADSFTIVVKGRQTHGSRPWAGVDPVVTAGQILVGLQTIVSRQLDITALPAVVTVGAIKGGIRFNIIPDQVEMVGTVRTFSTDMRNDIVRRMQATASGIAQANGATATVRFKDLSKPQSADEVTVPTVINDAAVTAAALPVFERLVGKDNVREIGLQTTADDFAVFAQQVPALYFWIGITPPDRDPQTAAFNHSPLFYLDEAGMNTGVRALLALTTEYLANPPNRGTK
ncbi:MAG TPA: amidohydrolase [Steroidobacteraceae bacterium]|nr:amidohydrolase [Steroidobacteraceae bacterium]